MMLTCKDATRLASEGLDRRLGAAERLALSLHLLICEGCARFRRQLAFMRRALSGLADR